MNILRNIKKWFQPDEIPKSVYNDFHIRSDVLRKYYTKEISEWLDKTNDATLLAVTGCRLNCHEWPEWLPSKPDRWDSPYDRGSAEFSELNWFICQVINHTWAKAEQLNPGIKQAVWLNGYHRDYKPKNEIAKEG